MRAYVDTPGHLSRAMFRVAEALRESAPDGVEIVRDRSRADFEVVHAIGFEALDGRDMDYAVIQYCAASAPSADGQPASLAHWRPLWAGARAVWSYYDLAREMPVGTRFYHAPLGVDGAAFAYGDGPRGTGIMTSGYVAGPGAEAIEEVAIAAERTGLTVRHLGPVPIGLVGTLGENWSSFTGVPDFVLAAEYRDCRWVSGLRHVEGFELPVLEGLACGARPIVFDRQETRRWFDGHVTFVPELSGAPLVDVLVGVLSRPPEPVSVIERTDIIARFEWRRLCEGFWRAVTEQEKQDTRTEQEATA